MDLCPVFIVWSDFTFDMLSHFTPRGDNKFEEISERQTTESTNTDGNRG